MKHFDLTKKLRQPIIEQDNVKGGYTPIVCEPVYVGFKTNSVFTRKNIINARRSRIGVVK